MARSKSFLPTLSSKPLIAEASRRFSLTRLSSFFLISSAVSGEPSFPSFPLSPSRPSLPSTPGIPCGPSSPLSPLAPFSPTSPLSPFSPFSPASPLSPFSPLICSSAFTSTLRSEELEIGSSLSAISTSSSKTAKSLSSR